MTAADGDGALEQVREAGAAPQPILRRWRRYDQTLEPLGGLSLEQTKTQVPRRVPVHPTLARVLSEWKSAAFERTYGRAPTAIDLVVPTRNFTERSAQETPKQLHDDLRSLGLRERRGHDLCRTFVTLAQVEARAAISSKR